MNSPFLSPPFHVPPSPAKGRQGAALILSVLLLAVLAVLVGFGRLAMYRNQVKLRLDREREIQQELATRSALRWLETCDSGALPDSTNEFAFATVRGSIATLLIPAYPIFPKHRETRHFDILDASRNNLDEYSYVSYASHTRTAPKPGNPKEDDINRAITRQTLFLTQEGETGEIRLDLPKTDNILWTDHANGLRYLVNVENFGYATPASDGSDHLRIGLTPLGQAAWEAFGQEKVATRAIWMDQFSVVGENGVRLQLHARTTESADVELGEVRGRDGDKSKGLQLAETTVSLIDQALVKGNNPNLIRRSEILITKDLDAVLGDNFTAEFRDACADSGGIRLTVQVQASSKPDLAEDDKNKNTEISQISVRPAYEYLTELSWAVPSAGKNESEVSTVIRCKGPEPRGVAVQTVTYDTHGTYANRKGHLGDIEK